MGSPELLLLDEPTGLAPSMSSIMRINPETEGGRISILLSEQEYPPAMKLNDRATSLNNANSFRRHNPGT
jgi:ABC-type branched-subunit amino acid transport system ATPase component